MMTNAMNGLGLVCWSMWFGLLLGCSGNQESDLLARDAQAERAILIAQTTMRPDTLIPVLTRVVESDGCVECYRALGVAYYRLGELSHSDSVFQKALSVYSDSASSAVLYLDYIKVLLELGKSNEAMSATGIVRVVNPGSRTRWYNEYRYFQTRYISARVSGDCQLALSYVDSIEMLQGATDAVIEACVWNRYVTLRDCLLDSGAARIYAIENELDTTKYEIQPPARARAMSLS
ncbi:MAG: hypothetical protein IPJ76_14700 [Flavobacteriales bacterium]|nr:MAG: hypothetical protein IPJ76_14700 [Flavobacteriales bacterium]